MLLVLLRVVKISRRRERWFFPWEYFKQNIPTSRNNLDVLIAIYTSIAVLWGMPRRCARIAASRAHDYCDTYVAFCIARFDRIKLHEVCDSVGFKSIISDYERVGWCEIMSSVTRVWCQSDSLSQENMDNGLSRRPCRETRDVSCSLACRGWNRMSAREIRKRIRYGKKDYDSDDDKCFLRRNMIYTFIRIVVPDFPRRWCIMMVVLRGCVCLYVGSGSFSMGDRLKMPTIKKNARAWRLHRP